MSTEEEREKKLLISKRGQIKGKITRFKSFIDSFNEDQDFDELELRLSKVKNCWEEFDDIQGKLELLDDDTNDHSGDREEFEAQYFSIHSKAEKYLKHHQNAMVSGNTHTSCVHDSVTEKTTIPVRLPTINLPTFAGHYEEWIPFFDSFQALIHNNDSLTDVQKLHYLRGSLRAEAAETIKNLELTSANYEVAIALLEQQYKNTKVIVQNHIKALFELPPAQRDSPVTLRKLLTGTLTHLRALNALDQPTDSWDALIVYLTTTKLDNMTYKEWELTTPTDRLPTFKEMTEFIQRRCQVIENIIRPRQLTSKENKYSPTSHSQKGGSSHRQSPKAHVAVYEPLCRICKGEHPVYKCTELLQASYSNRIEKLKRANLCFNCLTHGHTVKQCTSRGCRTCGKKHNTVLHHSELEQNMSSSKNNHHPTTHENGSKTTDRNITCNVNTNTNCEVILSTALVNVVSSDGLSLTCRAFLDNGSQSNFITADIAQKLRLKKERSPIVITGITQEPTHIANKVRATIKSKHTSYSANTEFLVLPKITGYLPTRKIDTRTWDIPNITLADPSFYEPGNIDILIGQEFFFDLLIEGKIKHQNIPFIQNTKLGWIVGGTSTGSANTYTKTCCLSINDRIDQQLQRFWSIEEPTCQTIMTSEDKDCEKQYNESVTRGTDGRYTVKMPIKEQPNSLGYSKDTAVRRLFQVEKRLIKQPEIEVQYKDFMSEYEELGHMQIRNSDDKTSRHNPGFFLPHHPVMKDSTTTKLRVVFDASAKTSSSKSLNDILIVGPTIQDDLISIILRFRLHIYVMTADIEKMYRQIWIDPSQRELLKLVWRDNPTNKVKTYQLNTVTYGTACAPYLAIRTLHQLATDEGHNFPEASTIVKRDFYVDDLMTGADTIDEALKLQSQLISLLQSGGFNLRKWNANHNALLHQLPTDMIDRPHQEIPSEGEETSKALGLLWDATRDYLQFKYTPQEKNTLPQCTKRTILSDIARLFDPIGLVSPLIIRAKLLLQDLWRHKLGWDDELPIELQNTWIDFQHGLTKLQEVKIPRGVTADLPGGILEIHGFSDASEKAYGAAVYIRHILNGGSIKTTLLCSKSKVSPLKTVSLPRLELCGALLLAELVSHVKRALHNRINKTYYWTDSTIVLAWLASEAASWKTFVANRVAKIHDWSRPEEWRHVRSADNPADLVSRGTNVSDLMQAQIWWTGPQWLSEDETCWPTLPGNSTMDENLERKQPIISAQSVVTKNIEEFSNELIHKFSSFNKLQRVTAYCIRFIHNCRYSNKKLTGPLSPTELYSGLKTCLKIEQNRHFSQDQLQLRNKEEVHKKSKLVMLKPFIDKDGLIRVGGRLEKSEINYDQKHPILLSDKSYLTELIIKHEHIRSMHAGPQLLLSTVRQQFWPINGRNVTRKIVHNCIPCFRAKPKWTQPEMGNLPPHRTTPSRPFTNTGVDYCGPIFIRSGTNRRASIVKTYIAVFVCFSTKAIHLELVTDLTTQAFLAAFKRFIARRGLCKNIYSDNGSNFIGASRELKELFRLIRTEDHQAEVKNTSSVQNINWHFIPPKSPHFGGLWEAGVKNVKYHLKRVAGNTNMSFEQLYTTLTLIEACLNSRPLTPLSSDPNDPTPLTPGHFLTGEALTVLPELDLTDTPINRLSHWQRAQQLMQHFWKRWSKEYLTELQQRRKWTSRIADIQPGQVVLIRDDNLPPLKWVIAVVQEVHPGADGRVRVATVKTPSGTFKRAVNRLCVMPSANNGQK